MVDTTNDYDYGDVLEVRLPQEYVQPTLSEENVQELMDHRIESDYDSYPALRASELVHRAENFAYWNGRPIVWEKTAALEFGTAFHASILEPIEYAKYKEFIAPVNPRTGEPLKGGKAYDEAKNAFVAAGNMPISPEDKDRIDAMTEAFAIAGCHKYLDGALLEFPFWYEMGDERQRKVKVDILSPEHGIIDLKTTSKSPVKGYNDDGLRWEIFDRLYIEKLAFYRRGIEAITGVKLPVKLIFIQSSKPYTVAVYDILESTCDACECHVDRWESYYYGDSEPQYVVERSL